MTGDAHAAGEQPRPLRARRQAATREEISHAALDLFERQGYAATTVEQIASAAGVSLRTFYRYCASKDEALAHELAAGPAQLVARIIDHPDLPLREAVIAGFVDTTRGPEHRRLLRAVLDASALRGAWLSAGRDAQDDLARVLGDRLPDATPLVVHAHAASVIAVLTAALEAWAASDDADLEQMTREALAVVAL